MHPTPSLLRLRPTSGPSLASLAQGARGCVIERFISRRISPLLFDAGVIVTVNTDDALMFGIGVTDEYLALYRAGVFTAAELDQIRLNGLGDQPLRA